MFDYHIHSEFSDDSTEKMKNILEEAIKKGGKKICFTEHKEFNYPDEDIKFNLNYNEYKKEVEKIKAIYKEKIEIYMGVEIGIQAGEKNIQEIIEYTKEHKFDFILASAHCLDGVGLYGMDPKINNLDDLFSRYFNEMLDVFKKFNDYDVVGHIDLIRRYFIGAQDHKLEKSKEVLKELFTHIIKEGKGIEVNTGGLFYDSASINPTLDILKLYKKMGGTIVTIGSDSHIAERVLTHYEKALEFLKDAGFEYITTFSQRKKEFHKIK